MNPTRLRECLTALRWSQRGLADALNRNEGWVRMMARGTRPIPAELAAWLEQAAAFFASHPLPPVPDGRRVYVVSMGEADADTTIEDHKERQAIAAGPL